MAKYKRTRIEGFLGQRINLKEFCSILTEEVAEVYDYRNIPGPTPKEKAINLYDLAKQRAEIGLIVYHLVDYWLDHVHGNSIVLSREKIHLDLIEYLEEVEQTGNLDKVRDVHKKLEYIGDIPAPVQRPFVEEIENVFENAYAILVGVGEYDDPGINSLPATINDVRALYDILTDRAHCGYLGGNVHTLTGPAAIKESVLASLDWLARKAVNNPDSTAIFYFSGHGSKEQVNGSSRYYLLPSDSDRLRLDSTAIGDELITEKLKKINMKRVAVILDVCHAGGITKDVEPVSEEFTSSSPSRPFLERLVSGSGRVVLSSAREDEKSYIRGDNTRSIFTHCLIDALSGKVKGNDRESIGIIDVYNYLDYHVPAAVETERYIDDKGKLAGQHPVFDGTKTNNFPIALRPHGFHYRGRD